MTSCELTSLSPSEFDTAHHASVRVIWKIVSFNDTQSKQNKTGLSNLSVIEGASQLVTRVRGAVTHNVENI